MMCLGLIDMQRQKECSQLTENASDRYASRFKLVERSKLTEAAEAAAAPKQMDPAPRKEFLGCHFELDGCLPAEEFRAALVGLEVEIESRLATMRAELLQLLQESSEALRQELAQESAAASPRRRPSPPAEPAPAPEAEPTPARRPPTTAATPARLHLARLPTDRLRSSAERMGIKAGGGKPEIIAAVLHAIQKQHRLTRKKCGSELAKPELYEPLSILFSYEYEATASTVCLRLREARSGLSCRRLLPR
ncbi:hypothetical protein AK812_SmicGene8080 [Symbiodinium microadriaticum]|uniref:SAP domain-containing protein n=1 Tax=Symbiodinium microadriaticum TaxID=2951 RepID=A0A1Q9ELW1_SYMMI|nr:hypothetical protein AK812_SmicGene8080 [Symbiodinium microadriaticum]